MYKHKKRWDISGIDDVDSPYGISTKIIENMLETLDKSSHMISKVNELEVNVNKRPKVTLEFKAKGPDGSSGEKEISLDFTLSYPYIPDGEIKINDCPIPDDLRQCILDTNSFFLGSSKYNEVIKEGLESIAVKASYLEMIKQIFLEKNFLSTILEEVCPTIVSDEGLVMLKDYEKFIPLYLYARLMKDVSVSTVRDAFNYSKPKVSRSVIIFAEKDEQVVLDPIDSRDTASDSIHR